MEASVGSLTDCAICMEELNNPKFLPCHHTMCLNCVEHICSSHSGRKVPCPFCRSLFNAPAASLPTNNYAEELVRLTREAKEAENRMEMVRDELEAVKTQLAEADQARQEAVDEKRRLDTTLTKTRTKLTAVERHSSQTEQQLESKRKELQQSLTAAESRESCLRDQLWEAVERFNDAECQRQVSSIEAKACQKAKIDAEASLAKEKLSGQNLRQQLEQMEREASEQLKDAERRHETAKAEAEACQKAKSDVEASLAKEKQSCQNLRQKLEQMEREASKQLKDAERKHETAKTNAEDCQKAKSDVEASLTKEKQSCQNLRQKLEQKEREASKQLKDAERRHETAKTKAEACQKAKSDVEASLEKEKQSCRNLRQQLEQMQLEASEQLKDAERRHERAKTEAEACQKAKSDIEASLAKEKQSCQNLRQQLEQMQVKSSKQLKDAERRHERAKTEIEACQKAKNGVKVSLAKTKHSCRILQQQLQRMQRETGERTEMLETELGQSKQQVINLNEQLAIERQKLSQQTDYKKSHAEGAPYVFALIE